MVMLSLHSTIKTQIKQCQSSSPSVNSSISSMPRQRLRLSLSLLVIPATFLSLSLLLLSWKTLGALPCFPSFKPPPLAASISDHQLPLNSSKPHKTITNTNTNSFSARASSFFSAQPPCTSRFHMTWISNIETFGQRELLSIQSIFKLHPKACLLILSSSLDSPAGAHLLTPLTSLGFRIRPLTPDFPFLLSRTPAKRWFRRLKQGSINPQNLSNLLRLAALYKFGGIYLDADVIILKQFSALRNVIGAQTVDLAGNWSRLNNAVLVFDQRHPLLYEFIKEFALTFDGSKWGHNGPYLVSRVVERVKGRRGFVFGVASPSAFYPVTWNRIQGFFKRPEDRRYERWVEKKLDGIRRESFAVHLWNRWSKEMEVEEGSLIGRIFADCCLICNSSSSHRL